MPATSRSRSRSSSRRARARPSRARPPAGTRCSSRGSSAAFGTRSKACVACVRADTSDADQFAPLRDQVLEPEIGELLLHRVLAQPVVQVLPVDLVEVLVLVEAGEDDLLEPPRRRIDVLLQ